MFSTLFVIKAMLTRNSLGFFTVALIRTDAYSLPFDLGCGLPPLGVAALVNFGCTIKQHMRIWVEFGHQRSSLRPTTQHVFMSELSATHLRSVARLRRVKATFDK